MPPPRRLTAPPSSPHATATMRANRGRDTKPELLLRSALHGRGLRFRKNLAVRVDGRLIRPDIAFTGVRLAVFVDGCFWHGCPVHGEMPASNRAFWEDKIGRNRERDAEQTTALEAAGWTVIRCWEHEPIAAAADIVSDTLSTLRARDQAERQAARRARRGPPTA
jgi:DNA mismatch endonuclease (patch repair protein)